MTTSLNLRRIIFVASLVATISYAAQAQDVRQMARAALTGVLTNADLGSAALLRVARPDADGRRLLARAMDQLGMTGRAHDRLLRVARTLADLEGRDGLAGRHVAEALQFRGARAAAEP